MFSSLDRLKIAPKFGAFLLFSTMVGSIMPLHIKTSVVLLAVALFASGCDLYGPLDRHYDTDAQPLTVAAVNFTDMSADQVLTGYVPIRIDLDTLNRSAVEATLYIDTREQGYPIGLPLPGTVVLPTADYPDGTHTLILEVSDGSTRLGLGTPANRATHVFSTPVTFRQTPLRPPTIEQITWDATGELALSWSRVDYPFFKAYRVMRRAAWAEGPEWVEIAHITDPGTTNFTEQGPLLIGAETTYRVDVDVLHGEGQQSELVSVQYGTPVFAGGTTRRPFVTGQQATAIVEAFDGALQAVDLDRGALLWEASPWIASGPDEEVHTVRSIVPANLTADGKHMLLRVVGQPDMYALHDNVYVYTVDLELPTARARRLPLDVPVADAVAGSDGRVVVLDSTESVHIVDAETGSSLGSVAGITGTQLRVTGDRRTALVMHYSEAGRCLVTSIDIATDAPRRLAERAAPAVGIGCEDVVFEGASTLIVRRGRNAVEYWNATTLERQAGLDLASTPGFEQGDWIRDVLPGAQGIYLAVQRGEEDPSFGPQGVVIHTDPTTLQVRQTWTLSQPPDLLGILPTEQFLMAYGGPFRGNQRPEDGPTAWKIDLR
jgi:hypothetical protein